MKSVLYILLLIFPVTACDYGNSNHDKRNDNHDVIAHTITYNHSKKKNPVYVISRNGAPLYLNPLPFSQIYDSVPYGEALDVVDTIGSWYEVVYQINNKSKIRLKGEENSFLAVFFIPIRFTGPIESFSIHKEDLNACYYYNHPQGNFDMTDSVSKIFRLELISEKDFLEAKQRSVNYLIRDTMNHPKINGKTQLISRNGNRIFTDQPDYGDLSATYQYVGRFENPAYYLIFESFYENSDYKLISIDNLKDTLTVYGIPLLSPNKQFFFSYSGPALFQDGEIQLFRMKNEIPYLSLITTYSEWVPANNGREMFIDQNGCIYTPVVPRVVEYDGNYNPNTNYQYLKISVL